MISRCFCRRWPVEMVQELERINSTILGVSMLIVIVRCTSSINPITESFVGIKVSLASRRSFSNNAPRTCVGAPNGTTIAGQSGVAGSWSYQFSSPTAITFDQYGNMYVMDAGNNRIQRWWPGSTYGITVVSASLSTPKGMTIDPLGDLLVADEYYHRVVSFAVVCRKFVMSSFFYHITRRVAIEQMRYGQ